MFDQPHQYRYPDKDICYTVDDHNFRPSWAYVRYGHKKNKNRRRVAYESCLGLYKCPEDGCNFTANPTQPKALPGRRIRKGMVPEKPLYQSTCIHHGVPLVHTGACPAFWTREIYPPTENHKDGSTVIDHSGKHNHGEPPNEKVSKSAEAKLKRIIQSNKRATPTVLKQGVEGKEPAQRLHPAFVNKDRLKYIRQKALKENNVSAGQRSNEGIRLEELATIEEDLGFNIFPFEPTLGRGETTDLSYLFSQCDIFSITKKNTTQMMQSFHFNSPI